VAAAATGLQALILGDAPVIWLWITLAVLGTPALALLALHIWVFHRYLPVVVRIFQEKPLFILPFGQPVADAEDVTLTTRDGLRLEGCYLRTASPRKGVILFGLEFGSKRWACLPYCEFLREAGYDIFTFEMRGQGNSPAQAGYEPLQWVTEFEVIDFEAAIAYLKQRPDRDERGVGFFGLSKGGGAGLIVAARDPFICCCATDGAFGTLTTMVPYMRQWILIYTKQKWLVESAPGWYYRYAGRTALRRIEVARNCRYASLENALPLLAPRPLLMIHGGADTYIKPEMARALFACAGGPSEFWLVDGAKHNQAMQIANGEYRRRVREFFDTHLARPACGAALPAPPALASCS
jgi:pimeloyl-ACP methyl ester carboxylesterase